MSKIKKTIFLIFSLVLLFSNLAFADNLDEKRIKERAEWAIDNIKPEYYEGIREDDFSTKSIGSGWITTRVHENHIYNGLYTVGAIQTQARWTSDYNLNVVDYEVVKFNAYKYTTTGVMNKKFNSYLVAKDNAKLIFTVTIVDFTGDYWLTHDYNLHGKGNYSFRVY
ncbi:hypothetical protein [Alkalithermobacter paradoxus]|uniref:DUF5626 domain-containing protein n=1 Tax=Alkalithermobacter paradoxus TaxID=29349 RepID=A0A1V4I8L5_9FIRM|nr:hypothetical protein CLOTH_07250 [[Clostridium] thermoalcaliphilum]